MEETRKSPNENKKLVIKLGGGGGGIGAVVLLGGALVTAAIASAFAVRRKRRSSGEDSSSGINEKRDTSKGEEIELEDESLKLDEKDKVETDVENDAVSEHGLVIVNEEFPLLAVKSDEGQNILAEREGDDEMGAMSSEEDAEVKEMQPRQEENNAVEADQSKEFEGFSNGDGEINEEKCVEKTILPLFESHAIQQDNLVDDDEEAPLPKEKSVEGHKFHQSEEGKQNPLDNKFSEETNIQLTKIPMELDGKKTEDFLENGCTKSSWEALWQTESTKESSMAAQLMKYEVGGKTEEDRMHDNGLGGGSDSSTRRLMIWVICVVSSLSFSWFFDLSLAKLCLFLFLTVFLSEIYGYSVPNRHRHDYAMQKEAVVKNKIMKMNANGVRNM